MRSRSSLWFVAGCLVGLCMVPAAAQTIRSNATQFPSVRVETNGTNGAPSISFLNATTKGFFRLDANSIGLAGHLVPGADATYDLGSSSLKFRNGYLSGTFSQLIGLFGDGSAGTPSISFTSAPTKGFYRFSTLSVGLSGNLVPGVDDTYDFGGTTTANRWHNGLFTNLVMADHFQVGIGVPSATNGRLRNEGGGNAGGISGNAVGFSTGDENDYVGLNVKFVDATAIQLDPIYGVVQPACGSSSRGILWFVQSDVGTADVLQICGRAADGTYAWVTVL